LNDDYLNKTLTVKYTGKGSNFQLGAKETFTWATKTTPAPEGKDEPAKTEEVKKFDQEVKVITNVEGKNVEAKFGKGAIRAWADFGVFNIGKDINVTAKVKTNDTFSAWNGWVSGEYRGPHCNASARVEVKRGNKPYLNFKTILTEKDIRVGLVTKVGLQGFDVKRHDFFANYNVNKDLSLWLGHYTLENDAPKTLGTILGAAVYRLNKHSVVFQGSWQKSTGNILATFGARSQVNDNTLVRAKVNNKGLFSLVAKRTHNRNLSVLAGTELDLTNPASAYKKDRAIPVPLFVSFEFTYN